MEDNLATFPIRKNETKTAYLRRIRSWKDSFQRGIREIMLAKPISQKHTWIEIETANGKVEFYINIKELISEKEVVSRGHNPEMSSMQRLSETTNKNEESQKP